MAESERRPSSCSDSWKLTHRPLSSAHCGARRASTQVPNLNTAQDLTCAHAGPFSWVLTVCGVHHARTTPLCRKQLSDLVEYFVRNRQKPTRVFHLQPCPATYRIALRTSRLDRLTFPRCRGRQCSIVANCRAVISMRAVLRKEIQATIVSTRPNSSASPLSPQAVRPAPPPSQKPSFRRSDS